MFTLSRLLEFSDSFYTDRFTLRPVSHYYVYTAYYVSYNFILVYNTASAANWLLTINTCTHHTSLMAGDLCSLSQLPFDN